MRPKVDAAVHLEELTRELDLSAFVLFSSISASFGAAGQADYSASNAYLDALAARLRAEGRPAHSLAWGLWAEGAGSPATSARRASTAGAARHRAAGRPSPRSTCWTARSPSIRRCWSPRGSTSPPCGTRPDGVMPPLFAGLVRPSRRRAAGGRRLREARRHWRGRARKRSCSTSSAVQIAAVLGHDSRRRGATPAGLQASSASTRSTAVELRNRLAAATGLRLPATLVFDHPTPPRRRRPPRRAGRRAAGAGRPRRPVGRADADEPIAIVGMGCRFPGGARSPEDLWRLVADGGDAISGFPDRPRLGPGPRSTTPTRTARARRYAREGGFLHDAAELRRRRSSASRRARRWPWTRSSGCCWRPRGRRSSAPGSTRPRCAAAAPASSSASCTRTTPRGCTSPPDGVEGYLLTGNDGQRRLRPDRLHASASRARRSPSTPPARRRWWRCTWPVQALRQRRVRPGAGRRRHRDGRRPALFVEFSRQRGLAADGRCKAFAAAADGTGWAEGVGMLRAGAAVRRPAERPPRCWPWCAARAVNQDGASNGLTAPERPVAAAGDPAGAGRRRARPPPTWTPSRRTAPAPTLGRPDRGAGAAGHVRPGPARRPAAAGSAR